MGRVISARALFDSTIVIDALLGIEAAVDLLDQYPNRAISVVTWIEVLAGVSPDDQPSTKLLLRSFRRVELTEEIVDAAVTARRAARLKLPDAIILAAARVEDRVLLTRDGKDFGRLGDSRVVIPYRL